jgi:hypothetical protein
MWVKLVVNLTRFSAAVRVQCEHSLNSFVQIIAVLLPERVQILIEQSLIEFFVVSFVNGLTVFEDPRREDGQSNAENLSSARIEVERVLSSDDGVVFQLFGCCIDADVPK